MFADLLRALPQRGGQKSGPMPIAPSGELVWGRSFYDVPIQVLRFDDEPNLLGIAPGFYYRIVDETVTDKPSAGDVLELAGPFSDPMVATNYALSFIIDCLVDQTEEPIEIDPTWQRPSQTFSLRDAIAEERI